jgi:hypothetical protein
MIRVIDIALGAWTIPLVRPFRFGIVELRELRHLLLRATFDIQGRQVAGFAGENLAPKWFSKRPETTIEQDVAALRQAVRDVAALATGIAAGSVFDLWLDLSRRVAAGLPLLPALVRQLGVSLVERCALDAMCRQANRPIHKLIRDGLLGVRPEGVYPRISGTDVLAAISPAPLTHITVRHTVGLADDLHELPSALAGSGVRRLKIKLGGDPNADARRLEHIADETEAANVERVTLDGNENYSTPAALSAFLRQLTDDPGLDRIRRRLDWIEQPLHRNAALADDVAPLLAAYPLFPHVIDESDDDHASLPRALELGYVGTTFKACKGVCKGLLAAALLRRHGRNAGRAMILSGEDLTIVAPWSQAQDLAAAAAIGVVDAERNGHHYAEGLSAFPTAIADAALATYPSLYARDPRGVVTLRIENGRIDATSASAAGFGGPPPPFDLLERD